MSDEIKKPFFYGDAHPELAAVAGNDHAYLSRLIGVKLAGLTIEHVAKTSRGEPQMDQAVLLKITMEEELARYEAKRGIARSANSSETS